MFVHWTVLFTPMTTVIVDGLNEKLLIETLTVDWECTTGAPSVANTPAENNPATRTKAIRLDCKLVACVRMFLFKRPEPVLRYEGFSKSLPTH